jgi:hypothetical protein
MFFWRNIEIEKVIKKKKIKKKDKKFGKKKIKKKKDEFNSLNIFYFHFQNTKLIKYYFIEFFLLFLKMITKKLKIVVNFNSVWKKQLWFLKCNSGKLH